MSGVPGKARFARCVEGWRRRPLFWLALALCAGVAAFHASGLPLPLPKDHLARHLSPGGRQVFLGGAIASPVEVAEGNFGARKTSFTLAADYLWTDMDEDPRKVRGRVRVFLGQPREALAYGDVVVVEGTLASMDGKRNPGGFDPKGFWHRRGVDAALYASKDARHKKLRGNKGHPVLAWAIRTKTEMSRRLSQDLDPRTAAFLQALLLGEKRGLDQDFRDLFLKTGTMHILAVSGFNIAFLTAAFWLFLRPVPAHRNLKILLLIGVIWAYCLLVGWQPPLARASVMATLVLAGRLTGRRADGLNLLGAAALFILCVAPFQVLDIGFQLSFLAVFGILVFVPRFTGRAELLPHEKWTFLERAQFSVQELFWVSFVCYVWTLPLIVQNFFIVTPYAVLANLLVVPAAFLLFFTATVYFLTLWLPPALFFVPSALSAMMEALTRCLFWIENLPGSVVTVGRLEPWLFVLMIAGIGGLLWRARPERAWRSAALVIAFCAAVFAGQEAWRATHRHFQLSMIDVGQGDSFFFEFPDGRNMLIDGGPARSSDKGRWAVSPYLRSKGVRAIDTLVISHPQEDHIGGLFTVLDDFRVRKVAHGGKTYDSATWERLVRRIEEEGSGVTVVGRGEGLEAARGVEVKVLHPPKYATAKDINDDSVVLKVVHGEDSFLMTGDIQAEAIRSLLLSGQDLEADVLKVPHHGAKLTGEGAALVRSVRPKFSLISAGARNPFGHPAPETLAILSRAPGNRVLRTDEEGFICLRAEGGTFSVNP